MLWYAIMINVISLIYSLVSMSDSKRTGMVSRINLVFAYSPMPESNIANVITSKGSRCNTPKCPTLHPDHPFHWIGLRWMPLICLLSPIEVSIEHLFRHVLSCPYAGFNTENDHLACDRSFLKFTSPEWAAIDNSYIDELHCVTGSRMKTFHDDSLEYIASSLEVHR